MSISPVSGVVAAQAHIPTAPAAKSESLEAPGAPDHDGDADNSPAPAAKAQANGRVDVRA